MKLILVLFKKWRFLGCKRPLLIYIFDIVFVI